MTITTDLLRLRAENEALKQSLQHESDIVEAAKEEIIRQRVENANQSEKINALVQERDRLLRDEYICKRCWLRKPWRPTSDD